MKYSKVLRGDPRDPQKGKKIYACAQSHEVVSLKQLCKHISMHHSVFDEATIQGVLLTVSHAIQEQLREGNQVDLGSLGKFYVTLDSEGVDPTEEFDPVKHIRALRPQWKPSKDFLDLRQGLSFEETTDRRTEKRLIREAQMRRQEG